jgi:hypothetical protein
MITRAKTVFLPRQNDSGAEMVVLSVDGAGPKTQRVVIAVCVKA